MEYAFFPVTLGQLGATLRYHDLAEGAFEAGAVHVTACYMNHPGLAMGYRLECDGATLVYATDHEPHSPHRGHPEDERHVALLTGADLVVHDAQYTLAEYPKKMTWGHSPAEQTVDFAVAAGVKRLALFHHDPLRTDDAIDALVAACRRRVEVLGGSLDVFGAAEGAVIDLGESTGDVRSLARAGARPLSPVKSPATPSVPPTVLIVDDDPMVVELLSETLRSEGLRLLSAGDGTEALSVIRAERPDLVLLDCSMPGLDGFEVCRAIRAEPDPAVQTMPVIMLTGLNEAEDTARGFAVGATDYLTKPFKTTHVRTRVQTWLVRSGA
jgi:CheY-like chemotaxis protein